MPVRILITKGTTADCRKAIELIEGFEADHLLADREYDTDAMIDFAKNSGMKPEIPPKKTEKSKESMTHIFINSGI